MAAAPRTLCSRGSSGGGAATPMGAHAGMDRERTAALLLQPTEKASHCNEASSLTFGASEFLLRIFVGGHPKTDLKY